MTATKESQPLDDDEVVRTVLQTAVNGSLNSYFSTESFSLPHGGKVAAIASWAEEQKVFTEALLGVMSFFGGKDEINPAIELATDKGTVTIPVKDIVEFKSDKRK